MTHEHKQHTVEEFFQSLPGKLDPEAAEGMVAVYQFDLSGPQGGQYYVQINDGTCCVTQGEHPEPHVTLSLSGEDCVRVLNGQLKGAAVAMSGRLRISGDMGLALQLGALFPSLRQ
ncbi:MAG TPA: SCP2 sterol-binding domain-containing protein [Nitrospiraceae bacterium]|nr:SCP2 sterol-binding domain-containing protein [Nitrospiraceae bacterium]